MIIHQNNIKISFSFLFGVVLSLTACSHNPDHTGVRVIAERNKIYLGYNAESAFKIIFKDEYETNLILRAEYPHYQTGKIVGQDIFTANPYKNYYVFTLPETLNNTRTNGPICLGLRTNNGTNIALRLKGVAGEETSRFIYEEWSTRTIPLSNQKWKTDFEKQKIYSFDNDLNILQEEKDRFVLNLTKFLQEMQSKKYLNNVTHSDSFKSDICNNIQYTEMQKQNITIAESDIPIHAKKICLKRLNIALDILELKDIPLATILNGDTGFKYNPEFKIFVNDFNTYFSHIASYTPPVNLVMRALPIKTDNSKDRNKEFLSFISSMNIEYNNCFESTKGIIKYELNSLKATRKDAGNQKRLDALTKAKQEQCQIYFKGIEEAEQKIDDKRKEINDFKEIEDIKIGNLPELPTSKDLNFERCPLYP